MNVSAIAPNTRLTIGISSCLLGNPVRYDGKEKYNPKIIEWFTGKAAFIPVCPEMEIGMGVPRPPIRLIATPDGIRAQGLEQKDLDVTEPLRQLGKSRVNELTNISGYIFKARSPSCGLRDTPVLQTDRTEQPGRGLFADAVTRTWPLLPVADENELIDSGECEHFLARVNMYRSCQALLEQGLTAESLTAFHQQKEFVTTQLQTELTTIIKLLRTDSAEQVAEQYFSRLLALQA